MGERAERTSGRAAKRKRLKGIRMVLNGILILVLLLLAVAAAIFLFCGIETVRVEGTEIYSGDELKNLVLNREYASDNTVLAWWYSRLYPREDIPFVEAVEVSLEDRHSLLFSVTETPFSGCFALSDGRMYAYFDENGYVTDISERFFGGKPVLTGVTCAAIGIGDSLPVPDDADRRTISRLYSGLKEQRITADEVHFEASGELSVRIGFLLISLGTRADLDQKIRRLPQILEKLEEGDGTLSSGILHMETWTPESTDIVFEAGDPDALAKQNQARSQIQIPEKGEETDDEGEEGEDGSDEDKSADLTDETG